jgi:GlpG protein
VIELAAFKEHRVILAFSDYLKSVGISNSIEAEPDRFALILHKQEDVERAEKELAYFFAKSSSSTLLASFMANRPSY